MIKTASHRVKGMYMGLGYSEEIAITLAALYTHSHFDKVILDEETYYVSQGI